MMESSVGVGIRRALDPPSWHDTPLRWLGQWHMWLAHVPTEEQTLPSRSLGHQLSCSHCAPLKPGAQ